ncbi:CLUMA_CG021382, isoform A [Clunio marinus]|uniref:S-adenosylmethionine sensor upstream of mTORC1 n=1 Tax=Clunio marinus TaxID=568069 RepID=A0A1J1J812_9DIPT|nr:CLUMA_CG021382, isoform A [Clunio marinus]
MCTLRPFVCNDMFKFNGVNLDPLTETYGLSFYMQYLAHWPEYFQVAESPSGEIMGYIMGKAEGHGESWHGHVTALSVSPDYRRLGLAATLMKFFEDVSEKKRCFFVDLFVRVSNKIAINMYHQLGYIVYRTVIEYYSGDEDAYDMRKALKRDVDKKSMIPQKLPNPSFLQIFKVIAIENTMASEEHRKLASTIKSIHMELRDLTKEFGADEAWKRHINDKKIRTIYAESMRKLAEIHWVHNQPLDDRIQWTINFCDYYFQKDEINRWKEKDLKVLQKLKDEGFVKILNEFSDIQIDFKLEVLDVGSSGNFFKHERFNVIPIDISPSHDSVYYCDFLSVSIDQELQCNSNSIETLPREFFHVVIFCLLLEYLPTSQQRIKCCEKAFKALKTEGILVIITPDSNHEMKNSKQIKNWRWTLAVMGFQRIKFEKLKNLTCMVFRKSLKPEIPLRWANNNKEDYMEFKLEIPQDKSKVKVIAEDCKNEKQEFDQLILILISVISVTVLIVYKSENERLNHVLSVINFFGQRDAISLVKIENYSNFSYRFDYPLPSWIYLSNEFHGYSAFWKKNDLVAGGEAIALAIGSVHGNVLFQCKIHFTDNTIANGKFGFMRVEAEIADIEVATEKFIIYKFICKTKNDNGTPKNLILINTETKSEHYLPIRHMTIKNNPLLEKSLLTVCLDLNSYNRSFTDDFITDTNIAQYFLHHELIGIRNFIIYNSNINQMNQHVIDLLTNKYGIRLNVLPYNFPLMISNRAKNRAIIEADCFLRTSGLTKYVMVASVDEYLYPSQKLSPVNPLIKFFNRYSSEVSRFEISMKSVCTDPHKKINSDNERYSVDIKTRVFYIQKNEFPYNDKPVNDIGKKSIEVDRNFAVIHKYIKCPTTQDLYDWRTTMEKSHQGYIDHISQELNKLLFHQ